MADRVGELLFPTLTGFDTVNITNKSILGGCLDVERYDKSNTNLEGNELGSGPTLMHPFGACTRVGPDPLVDTRPRSPLLVGIIYVLV